MPLLAFQGREKRADSDKSEEWCDYLTFSMSSSWFPSGGKGRLASLGEVDDFDEYMFAGMMSSTDSVFEDSPRAATVSPSEQDELCIECASGGAHAFREQISARPMECSGCDRLLAAGSVLFGCSRCAVDLCEECHAAGGRDAAPSVQDLCEEIHAPATESQDVTPDFEDREASFGDVDSLLSDTPMEDMVFDTSCGSCSTAATDRDLEEVELSQCVTSMAPVAGKKMCSHCFASYRGFGVVCGACRKSGQRGEVKECPCCGAYFQGFGVSCTDCRVTTALCA